MSDTFDNIVRNCSQCSNYFYGQYTYLSQYTPDVEEVLPFTRIYDPNRVIQHVHSRMMFT